MNDEQRRAAGMAKRRQVLGDAHVDRAIAATTPLTADFQDLITRYAWGEIWTRPGLDLHSRRVLSYDTRGHGASDAPPGDYSIDRLSRDLVSLLDHVGIARADLAGVSIGGLTGLWLGVHAPDRVRRLVLANTAARIVTVEFWSDRMRLVAAEGLAALADATMERWFTPEFRAAQPATVARMRATLLASPVLGYLGCCAALRDADLRTEAGRVLAPTLVVTGAHDRSTPSADGLWLADTIPDAHHVEFDAAHLTNVECASAFTDAVQAFLDAA
jgi:3-oxoadipate enol-lactonase